VVGPTLYAYENIPAALSAQHISTVLKVTRKDHSSMGLRDYAILQLLSTYGLRSGEITRLRIETSTGALRYCTSVTGRLARIHSCP